MILSPVRDLRFLVQPWRRQEVLVPHDYPQPRSSPDPDAPEERLGPLDRDRARLVAHHCQVDVGGARHRRGGRAGPADDDVVRVGVELDDGHALDYIDTKI